MPRVSLCVCKQTNGVPARCVCDTQTERRYVCVYSLASNFESGETRESVRRAAFDPLYFWLGRYRTNPLKTPYKVERGSARGISATVFLLVFTIGDCVLLQA